MIATFSHDDIQDWTNFSADDNPIHFDINVAKDGGLRNIVVQGMLVMLRAKSVLEPYIKANSCLNFYLKKPVYVDEPVEYKVVEKNKRIFLKVFANAEYEEAITASITYDSDPLFDTPKHKLDMPTGYFEDQTVLFKKLYPKIDSNSTLVDALLFSICFKYQKGKCFYDIPGQQEEVEALLSKHKAIILQTSHKVFISEKLFKLKTLDASKLSVSYESKDAMRTEDMLHLFLNYQIFYDNDMLYQAEIGGITKLQAI